MKFSTMAEAYAFYKNCNVETLESRSKAIQAEISGNADADIAAFNIELEGIEAALAEKRSNTASTSKPSVFTAGKATEDAASSREYRNAFLKTMQGRELDGEERNAFNRVNETRSSVFNTLSESAAVVPTQMLDTIITKARDKGGVISVARAFNMPCNISIPVATPGSAASWHVEGATVESEKATPASVTFSAYEIMRILSISAATRTMALDAFESYLTDEISASIMQTLGVAMLSGTGVGQGTGILTGIEWATTGAGANALEFSDELSYHDVLRLVSMLHRGYGQNAKFAMNNSTLYNHVYGLHDDNDQPLLLRDLVQAGSAKLLGFDIVIDDFMPNDTVLFGDFSYAAYNLPSGIALDVSRESSFKQGLVDYRGLAIADCKPIVPEAFVKLSKGE